MVERASYIGEQVFTPFLGGINSRFLCSEAGNFYLRLFTIFWEFKGSSMDFDALNVPPDYLPFWTITMDSQEHYTLFFSDP